MTCKSYYVRELCCSFQIQVLQPELTLEKYLLKGILALGLWKRYSVSRIFPYCLSRRVKYFYGIVLNKGFWLQT